AVRNDPTPNFSSVHQRPMVLDRDVSQRDALFYLGSLAYVRKVQIVLRGSDLAKTDDGETKNKRLKRDCFHIVAVTVPEFRSFATINSLISGVSTDRAGPAFNARSRS